MTILEPILYANGALRLTRHGAGKGDTVLLFEYNGETFQIDVRDDLTDQLRRHLEGLLANNAMVDPVHIFRRLQQIYPDDPDVPTSAYNTGYRGAAPSAGPGWYHH